MSMDFAIDLYREMLRTTILVAAPVLGVAMLVGLIVSLLQTLTSLNEQTLTFVHDVVGAPRRHDVILLLADPPLRRCGSWYPGMRA